MPNSHSRSGTVYLTVRPDPRKFNGLVAVKVTNKPPTALQQADDRVVKLNVAVPRSQFQPLDATPVFVDEAEDIRAEVVSR